MKTHQFKDDVITALSRQLRFITCNGAFLIVINKMFSFPLERIVYK